MRLSGRTFLVDLVMQTPDRFGSAVRTALELELPSLRPAAFRARFQLSEESDAEAAAADLAAIARRGSDGVILKAPDSPRWSRPWTALAAAGIPVVTFVTDLPFSRRVAYVGVDNRAAGATAAYLVTRWSASEPGGVLVTLSSATFRGEEEREIGFRATLRELAPRRTVVEVTDTDGLDSSMLRAVGDGARGRPRDRRGLLDRRRQQRDARRVPRPPAGRRPCSSPTTSTATTGRCCAAGRSRPCSTTTCAPTCGAPAGRSCRPRAPCPASPSACPSQIQVVTPYNEPGALVPLD